MSFRQCFTFCLSGLCIFFRTALCVPTEAAFPPFRNIGNGLNVIAPKTLNTSACGELGSSADIVRERRRWPISEALSLELNICNWKLDAETVQAVLAAAAVTVGKKSAAVVLDRKFIQKSNNKYNTLNFEISPDHFHPGLTWADLAEILGDDGLPKFYDETRWWRTLYFEVMHTTKGEIAQGAVRRWWQLEPPKDINGTAQG